MKSIKVTSKRQVTFPVDLCRDMGIQPGDELVLENRMLEGKMVWVIVPQEDKLDWLGAFKSYTKNKSHDMEDIRRSIGRGGKK